MIRAYQPEDLSQLLDAWHSASLVAHHFLTDEFLAQERVNIVERYLPVTETWVYEQDGRVVGFISMLDNEVGAIFVEPDSQGRGVGRALMDHVRASREVLELNVFRDNPIGRRFYAGYGFNQIGENVCPDTGEVQLRLRLET